MFLPRSLRVLLGTLAGDLDDPDVREIMIPGPRVARVVRDGEDLRIPTDLTEARVRALALRLRRALGGASRGRLGDLDVLVVEPTRGRGPIIRLARRALTVEPLSKLHERGLLTDEVLRFLQAPGGPPTLLITGPRGSGKTALLRALAAERPESRRVAVLEEVDLTHDGSGPFDLVLPIVGGVELALELGAELIAVDTPPPAVLAALLRGGCPFVATLEVVGHERALEWVAAALLSTYGPSARAAVEGEITAVVERVLELGFDADNGALKVVAFESPTFPVASASASTEDMPVRRGSEEAKDEESSREAPVQRSSEKSVARAVERGAEKLPERASERAADKAPDARSVPMARAVLPERRASTEDTPAGDPSITRDVLPPSRMDASPPPEHGASSAPRSFARHLSGAAGLPNESASPMPVTSFDNPELSGEIRPEQLLSDSFVMSLDDIHGEDALQRVIAVDLETRDGILAPPLASGGDLRREAPERTPTVVQEHERERAQGSTPPVAEGSGARSSSVRDKRRDGLGAAVPTEPSRSSGDGGSGRLAWSPLVDESLAPSELDATQSAHVGEMAFPLQVESGIATPLPSLRLGRSSGADALTSGASRGPSDKSIGREATLDLIPSRASELASEQPSRATTDSEGAIRRRSASREGTDSAGPPVARTASRDPADAVLAPSVRTPSRDSSDAHPSHGSAGLNGTSVSAAFGSPSFARSAPRDSSDPRSPSLTGEEIEDMLDDLPGVSGSEDAGPSDDEPGAGSRKGSRPASDLRPRRRLR